MNILKKGLALSIATVMALTPAISMADVIDSVPISETVVVDVVQVKEADYIEFSGKIKEVTEDNGNTYILVANDDEGFNELRVVFGEAVLLSDKTMDLITKDSLKKDLKVSVFYHKNTPMTLSLPPMLTPEAIVIRENEDHINVNVSRFDEELLNAEGDLYLRVNDKTNIADTKSNKLTTNDLKDRDLLFFYTIVMESFPAQTGPEKIIVLPKREVTEEPEETPSKVKQVVLGKELQYVNDKGVAMIPLRYVAEELGYEVKWNAEARTVEILKGPQWSLITIGKDIYNFARMNIELGTAPVIVNDHTFVPLNFAEEVLVSEVVMMDNGDVKIIQKQ